MPFAGRIVPVTCNAGVNFGNAPDPLTSSVRRGFMLVRWSDLEDAIYKSETWCGMLFQGTYGGKSFTGNRVSGKGRVGFSVRNFPIVVYGV